MLEEIGKIPFTRKILYLLAQKESTKEEDLEKYYKAAEIQPDADAWLLFIKKFILSLGVLFTISGIIFFFAYNWRDLHKFVKLGIIASLILIPTLYALFTDLQKFPAKIALLATAVFSGSLLAVFGQVYQTGANAYDLFLNWSFLILGIVVISQFPPLWLLWVILINTSLVMYAGQILRHWVDPAVFIIIFLFNTALLALWEYLYIKNVALFKNRWFPRLIGIISLSSITVSSIVGIVTDFDEKGHIICMLLAIAGFTGIYRLYSKMIFDLSLIAFSCVCVICIIFSSMTKAFDAASMFFIGGFIIIGLTVASVFLLINTNKQWKAKI